MQSLFSTYLEIGLEHIADIRAYDHIVFIIALCAIYSLKEWKHVLILVTAFTIGHSITLALAIFDIIQFPASIIELLIPITILITCFFNVYTYPKNDKEVNNSNQLDKTLEATTLVSNKKQQDRNIRFNYLLALFFGLIHGMGFSNFLRSSLMPGQESQLGWQLFAFNIGIELGQLLIVAIILSCSFIALNVLKVKQRDWMLFISGAAAGISVTLLVNLVFSS